MINSDNIPITAKKMAREYSTSAHFQRSLQQNQ